MKAILLLLALASVFLSSCAHVRYDPEYEREAAQIQDTDYPANQIVGSWMQVGFKASRNVSEELRHNLLFRADGTGLTTETRMIPTIYEEFRDLFVPDVDFSGEHIVEKDIRWIYLGKNKWEIRRVGSPRLVAQPSWIKSTTFGPSQPYVVRYHAGKLFFPGVHSTAVSIVNEADAKAKLATIRSLTSLALRRSLEADRARRNLQLTLRQRMDSQPIRSNSPGY